MYLLLCLFSSAMAVLALSSWAAKQGSGFAVDELTGQLTGIGDYRRAVVQAGAAAIGILVAILLSNIDYRSLVNVWPVHVVLTWGLVLPTLVIRNVTIGPLTIGYNAGDTDNYSWYKLGGFTFQPTELAKISFILTFAMHLNNVRSRLNEPKELGKLLLHLFVPIGIIHIQGDDGTAIIYGIIGCCMLFAAGLSWKYIVGAFAALAAAAAAAFAFFSACSICSRPGTTMAPANCSNARATPSSQPSATRMKSVSRPIVSREASRSRLPEALRLSSVSLSASALACSACSRASMTAARVRSISSSVCRLICPPE